MSDCAAPKRKWPDKHATNPDARICVAFYEPRRPIPFNRVPCYKTDTVLSPEDSRKVHEILEKLIDA